LPPRNPSPVDGHNQRVAVEINNLIGKIAHLHRPDDLAHEKHLVEMIAQTWRAIEFILSCD
jgi:hypothetical protein